MSQSNDSGLNLDHLEALARAATPGPWALEDDEPDESTAPRICLGSEIDEYGAPHTGMRIGVEEHHVHPARKPKIGGPQWNALAAKALDNANFIAAANPAAVLELIALARRAALANQPAPTVPATHCSHAWNDFGQLGGRNVSWCPRCDVLAWTGKEPAQEQAEGQPVWIVNDDRGEHVMMCPQKPSAEAMNTLAAKIARNVTVLPFVLYPAAQQEPVAAPGVVKPELMRQAVATVVSRVGDHLRIGWLRPERCDVGTLLYCATERAAELDGGQEGSESNG